MFKRVIKRTSSWLLLAILLLGSAAQARELRLGIQPMLDDVAPRVDYQDLAKYLSGELGMDVEIDAPDNILRFWRAVNGHGYDLVLAMSSVLSPGIRDGWLIGLAGALPERRYQLVTLADAPYRNAQDVIAHRVAGQGAPSPASLSFSELYPDAMRQPDYQVVESVEEALNALHVGSVAAVMLPASRVEHTHGLRVLGSADLNMKPLLAADAYLDVETSQRVHDVVLRLGHSVAGLRALDNAWLGAFEPLDVHGVVVDAEIMEQFWYY